MRHSHCHRQGAELCGKRRLVLEAAQIEQQGTSFDPADDRDRQVAEFSRQAATQEAVGAAMMGSHNAEQAA